MSWAIGLSVWDDVYLPIVKGFVKITEVQIRNSGDKVLSNIKFLSVSQHHWVFFLQIDQHCKYEPLPTLLHPHKSSFFPCYPRAVHFWNTDHINNLYGISKKTDLQNFRPQGGEKEKKILIFRVWIYQSTCTGISGDKMQEEWILCAGWSWLFWIKLQRILQSCTNPRAVGTSKGKILFERAGIDFMLSSLQIFFKYSTP